MKKSSKSVAEVIAKIFLIGILIFVLALVLSLFAFALHKILKSFIKNVLRSKKIPRIDFVNKIDSDNEIKPPDSTASNEQFTYCKLN